MALDAGALADLMALKLRQKYREKYSDEVVDTEVTQVPKEDGTMETVVTQTKGPLEIAEEEIRPLVEAIAEAVVSHIKSNADVVDESDGDTWRVS